MLVVVLTANASLQAAIPWLMPGTDAHFLDPTSVDRFPPDADVCLVDVGSTAAGLALMSGLRAGPLRIAPTPIVLIGDEEPSEPPPDGVHLVIRPVDLEHLRQLLEGFRPDDETIEEEGEEPPSLLSRFLTPVFRGRAGAHGRGALETAASDDPSTGSPGTPTMDVAGTPDDGRAVIDDGPAETPDGEEPGAPEETATATEASPAPLDAGPGPSPPEPTVSEARPGRPAEGAREPTVAPPHREDPPASAHYPVESQPAVTDDAQPAEERSESPQSSPRSDADPRPATLGEPAPRQEADGPVVQDGPTAHAVGEDRHEPARRAPGEAASTPGGTGPSTLARWWARLRTARIHRKVARHRTDRGEEAPPDGVRELLDRVGEVPALRDPAAVAGALAAELRDEGAVGPIVVLLRTREGFRAIGGSDITKAQSRALVPGDHPLVELLAGRPGGLMLLEGQHGGTALVRGVPVVHGDATAVIPLHDDDGVLAITIIGGLGGRPPALIRTVEEGRDFLALLAWLESRRMQAAVIGG